MGYSKSPVDFRVLAERVVPSDTSSPVARTAPYLGRSRPGKLMQPPAPPCNPQLPPPHSKSCVAIIHWLAGGRHVTLRPAHFRKPSAGFLGGIV